MTRWNAIIKKILFPKLWVILLGVPLAAAGLIFVFTGDFQAEWFAYSAFSVPMLMGTCLSVFVRNDGSPALSFVGMCAGAAANIFLDWLFIFPMKMGVVGAAIASGLGQVLTVLILLTYFQQRAGADRCGLGGLAALRPVLCPHGAEPHLHGVLLLYQAHRYGRCYRCQPRHRVKGAADLLPAAVLRHGSHLARTLCH